MRSRYWKAEHSAQRTVKDAFGSKAHLPKKTLASVAHEAGLMWELWTTAFIGSKTYNILDAAGYYKEATT